MTKNKERFRLRSLIDFSKSKTWQETLKPELEKIVREHSLSEGEAESIEEAAFRDIKRSTAIKIINRIIRLIERAEDKLK